MSAQSDAPALSAAAKAIALFGAGAVPLALAPFGLTGSWSFTFPTVIIWCVAVRLQAVCALGLTGGRPLAGIALGAVSGIGFGIVCGELLKALGIAGIDPHTISLPLPQAMADSFRHGFTGMHTATLTGTPQQLAWYFLYYIFSVGLGEELFWRGLVQQELKRFPGRRAAIATAGVLFGGVHAFLLLLVPFWPGMGFLAAIAVGGVLWGVLFEYTRNIWGLAVSHGLTSAILWKYYFFA